ncbi:MAG: (2Fe-2S) ferredoxin domain-containing protein [Nannocystaceae bacterium]
MSAPAERAKTRLQILVCDGPSCGVTYESELLKELIERTLAGDDDLKRRCTVVDYNCFGRCGEGPNLFVRALGPGDDAHEEPDPDVLEAQRGFYPGMSEAKCARLIAEHCAKGQAIADWVDDY